MEDADGFDWDPPTCTECNAEVDVLPVATGHGLNIQYVCPIHGVTLEAGPFA